MGDDTQARAAPPRKCIPRENRGRPPGWPTGRDMNGADEDSLSSVDQRTGDMSTSATFTFLT